ncbi:MAG: hypothetical protein HY810_02445 [Candidatus Omnitrophica bacterium]|nr:hypothetical protein [Candidatus Omnitrophota bacterium]
MSKTLIILIIFINVIVFFNCDILVGGNIVLVPNQGPEIIFKKFNPTKYLVKVQGAKKPFWLVFSEGFHSEWKLYKCQSIDCGPEFFSEVDLEYPDISVKESKPFFKFTPGDIKFLFEKPFDIIHEEVNEYSNGWYIDPDKLGLGEDFTFVLFFYPQAFFYLGFLISIGSFLCCLVCYITGFLNRKNRVR